MSPQRGRPTGGSVTCQVDLAAVKRGVPQIIRTQADLVGVAQVQRAAAPAVKSNRELAAGGKLLKI